MGGPAERVSAEGGSAEGGPELAAAHAATPSGRPRARALGIPFDGTPGPWNAITDVPGVEVGYETLVRGESVRTGVTGIHPRGRAGAGVPVTAGFFSQNGNGEMTGTAWIQESGTFSGPVAITNSHAVGVAHAGIVAWTVEHHPRLADAWLLPVAAETYDGYLNDINGGHVTQQTVIDALDAAAPGPVEEGSVGGGTGMNCYQFKGGSGTASRLVGYGGDQYAVGVFVQANFGARRELTLAGVPLGRLLDAENPMSEPASDPPVPPGAGSVIAVVATDAPLLPHQCTALARRVTLGLARTGTSGLALLRRPVPGLLHRQPRRDHAGRHRAAAGRRGPLRPAPAHPVGLPGPVLHRGGAGHRGGGSQRPGRWRDHDRARRPPQPGPAPRAGRRVVPGSRGGAPEYQGHSLGFCGPGLRIRINPSGPLYLVLGGKTALLECRYNQRYSMTSALASYF